MRAWAILSLIFSLALSHIDIAAAGFEGLPVQIAIGGAPPDFAYSEGELKSPRVIPAQWKKRGGWGTGTKSYSGGQQLRQQQLLRMQQQRAAQQALIRQQRRAQRQALLQQQQRARQQFQAQKVRTRTLFRQRLYAQRPKVGQGARKTATVTAGTESAVSAKVGTRLSLLKERLSAKKKGQTVAGGGSNGGGKKPPTKGSGDGEPPTLRRITSLFNDKASAAVKVSAVSHGPRTSFQAASLKLSDIGKANIRALQNWAKSKGYVERTTHGGPQIWGVYKPDGSFSWRLKIKPEASFRSGLEAGSQRPRFDARLDEGGDAYINPFTNEIGGKQFGTHQDLEKKYF